MKRNFILILLSVSIFGCNINTGVKENTPKPNIVFILIDDLGWSDLGCYNNTYFETPHIDNFANAGTRFTRAYAACHVCSPTRASIFTGRYPARIGLTNFLYGTRTDEKSPVDPAPFHKYLPLEENTIAEELKKEGYKTALMGKWHLGENTSIGISDPEFQGFDITKGFDHGILFCDDEYQWYKIGDKCGGNELKLYDLTEQITQNSIQFLQENKDTTFALFVTHYTVHLPLQGKDSLISKYRQKHNPDPEHYSPVYAAMVENMDRSVGRILEELKTNNLMDNTIVVFFSDNGGLAMGEAGAQPTTNLPLRNGKGTMYEGGIRVPFILHWPGLTKPGSVNESIITSTDFFPTFLEAIKGEPFKTINNIDGKNFLPALTESEEWERGPIFWHYPHFSNQGGRPKSAILDEPYKLIFSLEDSTMELYNIREDIGETTNLADSLITGREELKSKLWDWIEGTNASLPVSKR